MSKWIICFAIVMLICIGFTSAADYALDNEKRYDEPSQTIAIWDKGLIGDDTKLVEAQLKSEQDVKVMHGSMVYVAEADFETYWLDYDSIEKIISDWKFTDLKTGLPVQKEITMKLKQISYENVTDYKHCKIKDGLDCKEEVIGSHMEEVVTWLPLEKAEKLDKRITVGFFTDVKDGENIDWQFKFAMADAWTTEWASWNASFNQSLEAYFNFNDTGDVTARGHNLTTNNNSLVGESFGKNGKKGLTNGYNYFNITNETVIDISSAQGLTVNFWINTTVDSPTSAYKAMWGMRTTDVALARFMSYGNKPYITVQGGGCAGATDVNCGASCADINDGTWQMLTVVLNATHLSIFQNGVLKISDLLASCNFAPIAKNAVIGAQILENGNPTRKYNASYDEFAIWERALTYTEIAGLYDGGAGTFYSLETGAIQLVGYRVNVTLNHPRNGVINSTSNQSLIATLKGVNANVTNATFYVWNSTSEVANISAVLPTNGINSTVIINTTINLTDETYFFNVLACGSNGTDVNCSFSPANITFTIDTLTPVVDIIYPANATNYSSNVSEINYTITHASGVLDSCWYSTDAGTTNITLTNCSTNATGVTSVEGWNNWTVWSNDTANNVGFDTVSFWKDTVYPQINYGPGTPANASVIGYSYLFINVTLNESNFKNITFNINSTTYTNITPETSINVSLTDGIYFYNVTACDTSNNCNATATRNVTIDTVGPNVNITYPINMVDFINSGTNLSVNFTVSDLNLDACWFSLDNGAVNETVDCSQEHFNITVTSSNNNTATFYANDTVGHTRNVTRIWDYELIFIGETYSSPVLEGSTNPFVIVFDVDASAITTAYLTYNNTVFAGSISPSGIIYTITRNIIAPSVDSETNISFYWNISKADGFNYTTPVKNQTVTTFGVSDNCTSPARILYNFTVVDEETRIKIDAGENVTGKVDLTIYSSNHALVVVNFSHLYSNENSFAVCINSNLSSNETYLIDTQVEYSARGYSVEFYNILNETLNISSLDTNITLYDLNSSQSQEFVLIARDTQYLPIYNALIYVKRKYIDLGTFYNVEIPKTDASGQAVASLQVNDVVYTFVIVKDGRVVSTFDNVNAVCQTPAISTCEIDFNAFASEIVVPDYETLGDLNFTLGYNFTTRAVSSIFNLPSGNPSTMVLQVTREDALGTAMCSNTLTSSSGTLSCTIPNSFGNSTALAVLYRDGIEVARGNVNLAQDPKDIYGDVLVYLIIFIFLTIIGIGLADSPILFAGFMILGVILLFAINIIKNNGFFGASATALFLIIAIIFVIVKMTRRT